MIYILSESSTYFLLLFKNLNSKNSSETFKKSRKGLDSAVPVVLRDLLQRVLSTIPAPNLLSVRFPAIFPSPEPNSDLPNLFPDPSTRKAFGHSTAYQEEFTLLI